MALKHLLALLSMELAQVNRSPQELPAPTRNNLKEIQKRCSEIANDVQSLSHQLHLSKLDFLGIAAAIKGFCNELSRQQRSLNLGKLPVEIGYNRLLHLPKLGQAGLERVICYPMGPLREQPWRQC